MSVHGLRSCLLLFLDAGCHLDIASWGSSASAGNDAILRSCSSECLLGSVERVVRIEPGESNARLCPLGVSFVWIEVAEFTEAAPLVGCSLTSSSQEHMPADDGIGADGFCTFSLLGVNFLLLQRLLESLRERAWAEIMSSPVS